MRSCLRFLVGILILGSVAGEAFVARADGIIIPDDPTLGRLAIVYHHVTADISDGVVTTHVDQVFRNDASRAVEGRYVFPIPTGAVVSGFSMWVDGERLEAQVLTAEDARAIYEDYVRRAIDPALLEYVGRSALSARIFPIPAFGERRIEITYSETLTAEEGLYVYRYPLDTERLSARPIEEVTVDVRLETSAPLRAVYSPSHEVTLERADDLHARVLYRAEDTLPSTDFLLYYAVSPGDLGMTLLTYRAPGEDGYFLAVLSPSAAAQTVILPKDLILVLDQSGSMSGEKIDQARAATLFILDNLNPEDRFAVVSFSDVASALTTALSPASSTSLGAAKEWVRRLEATGGTNIDQALATAFGLFDDASRPKFLVFLTDGEPTVGEEDPAVLLAHAQAANRAGARVFTFGVGYDVNTFLLDRLSQDHHGTTVYVQPGEDLEAKLSSFYRKIASPVLASPEFQVAGVETYELYPRPLPDLFRGSQLLVLGRYRRSGPASVNLIGDVNGETVQFSYARAFPDVALDASFLPRLWAGRKIAHLLDQIRLYGESGELVDEIIRLSTRYGVITPYTSFLVEEPPASAEAARQALGGNLAAAPSGQKAVQDAAALRTLAEGEAAPESVDRVKVIGDRAFFFRDGIWVESTYADEETIDLVYLSAAFFDLLDLFPDLGPYLALGDKAVLQVGSVWVRIGEAGAEELTDEIRAELLE
jgi:Ca-activated chloride channel family protein